MTVGTCSTARLGAALLDDRSMAVDPSVVCAIGDVTEMVIVTRLAHSLASQETVAVDDHRWVRRRSSRSPMPRVSTSGLSAGTRTGARGGRQHRPQPAWSTRPDALLANR